jgi:hypothetical protein
MVARISFSDLAAGPAPNRASHGSVASPPVAPPAGFVAAGIWPPPAVLLG